MNPKDNHNTCFRMPGINAGMLTLKELERITDLVRRYDVPMVKITGTQGLYFQGLAPEKHAEMMHELELPASLVHTDNHARSVQACPGKNLCKYGTRETEHMARAIAEMELDGPLPCKVKVGISGCRMCCCESWMRDVGLSAEKKGWRFTFGGNAAGRPRIGDLVADGLSDEEALNLVKKTLNYYLATAKIKTRSARFMERIGIEELKKAVLG